MTGSPQFHNGRLYVPVASGEGGIDLSIPFVMNLSARSGKRAELCSYSSSRSSNSGSCTGFLSMQLVIQAFARLVALVEGMFDLPHFRGKIDHGDDLVDENSLVIVPGNQKG